MDHVSRRKKLFIRKRSAPQVEETQLIQFTLCPDLPFELRLVIWKSALPGPCIIEIMDTDWDDFAIAVAKSSMILLLPLLRVCGESHSAALG